MRGWIIAWVIGALLSIPLVAGWEFADTCVRFSSCDDRDKGHAFIIGGLAGMMFPVGIPFGYATTGFAKNGWTLTVPRKDADLQVIITPKYWACTDSYLSHQKGSAGGMLTRFGRTSEYHYDYWECRCKQWSAQMVGKNDAPHKACSNGWMPKETELPK